MFLEQNLGITKWNIVIPVRFDSILKINIKNDVSFLLRYQKQQSVMSVSWESMFINISFSTIRLYFCISDQDYFSGYVAGFVSGLCGSYIY